MPMAPPVLRPSAGRNTLKVERKLADKHRPNANERGYNWAWKKARTDFLARHPLCAECLKAFAITAATIVDHIIPHRGDMELFWDRNNWQSLCETHHNRKTGSGQ